MPVSTPTQVLDRRLYCPNMKPTSRGEQPISPAGTSVSGPMCLNSYVMKLCTATHSSACLGFNAPAEEECHGLQTRAGELPVHPLCTASWQPVPLHCACCAVPAHWHVGEFSPPRAGTHLAEALDLRPGLALGVAVAATLAASQRQRGQRVLEHLCRPAQACQPLHVKCAGECCAWRRACSKPKPLMMDRVCMAHRTP